MGSPGPQTWKRRKWTQDLFKVYRREYKLCFKDRDCLRATNTSVEKHKLLISTLPLQLFSSIILHFKLWRLEVENQENRKWFSEAMIEMHFLQIFVRTRRQSQHRQWKQCANPYSTTIECWQYNIEAVCAIWRSLKYAAAAALVRH